MARYTAAALLSFWLAQATPNKLVKLKLHPHQRHGQSTPRRRRRRTTDGTRAAAAGAELYEGLWTHYVHLYVGTPPQKTSVIVDTGSSRTAFVCADCPGCGAHESPPFDTSKSSTYEERSGEMRASYSEGSEWIAQKASDVARLVDADGSVVAYDASDGTSLGDATVHRDAHYARIPFGCITHQTNMFVDQTANGIWGLHGAGADSVLKALHTTGAIGEMAFSLCFEPVDPLSKSSERSGFFVVGGVDTSHHAAPMAFAELKTSGAFNSLETLGVSLVSAAGADVSIEAPAGEWNRGNGLVVDSGTTDLYLPKKAHDAWVRAWAQVYPHWAYDADKTFTINEAELSSLPSIRFRFRGVGDEEEVVVTINPESFIEKVDRACTGACSYFSRVYVEKLSGGVLGGPFFAGHDLFFDLNRGRLGIARAVCDSAAGYQMPAAAPSPAPTVSTGAPAQRKSRRRWRHAVTYASVGGFGLALLVCVFLRPRRSTLRPETELVASDDYVENAMLEKAAPPKEDEDIEGVTML